MSPPQAGDEPQDQCFKAYGIGGGCVEKRFKLANGYR